MAERLKSILKRGHWLLALKGALFGASWLLFPGWLFLLAALALYFKPLFQPGKLFRSFLVLLAASFAARGLAPELELMFSGAAYFLALYLGGLFFFLMGIKDLAFTHRLNRYFTLYGGLFLAVLVFSFWHLYYPEPFRFLTVSLLFAAASVFLFREFLGLVLEDRKRRRLLVWTLALLTFELFWAAGLLPIGFLSQAALVLLFIILGTELLREHLAGALTRTYVLRAVTVLIFAVLGIFAASSWEL